MGINVAICDDEKTERDYLTTLTEKWADSRKVSVDITVFESAESFLFHYAENKSQGILLLDIQMKDLNGMDLAKQIRRNNSDIQIIFITGYPDFMSEGYDVNALHYLMKPVNDEKLSAMLDRAARNLAKTSSAIFLPLDGEMVRVSTDGILYIECFAHYLEINTSDCKYTVKMPVYELQQKLSDNFARCHRSYIVNLRHVVKISKTEVTLVGGKLVPLSRRLYDEVNKSLIRYFTGIKTGGEE